MLLEILKIQDMGNSGEKLYFAQEYLSGMTAITSVQNLNLKSNPHSIIMNIVEDGETLVRSWPKTLLRHWEKL